MTLKQELKKIKNLPVDVGSFNNHNIQFEEYPEFWKDMKAQLSGSGFKLLDRTTSVYGVEMPQGTFEVQLHDHSVESHTDKVSRRIFFGIKVLEIKELSKSVYSDLPKFNYYSPDGMALSTYLAEDEGVLIFNPRRKHSLEYFGKSVKLALFSVVKDKK